MNIDRLSLLLNTQQLAAVSAPRSNLLLLAGAGSGKTRVLVYRIAWLMEIDKCSPHSILAVTFTTKAAEEMRERLRKLIGIVHSSMWIGTFHSLSHRLLCIHYLSANLQKNFQIIDTEDQIRLLKRLIHSMNLDIKKWTPRQGLSYITAKKEKGLRPSCIKQSISPMENIWLRIYQVYQDSCDRLGLVDFSELLLRAYELLRDNPDILHYYHRIFTNILVDEFQDTNPMQYSWVRTLASRDSNVMIVGDDDQSIYGWRGAKTANMQNFLKDFSLATIMRLERNYRSTSNILEAANILISNNHSRMGKKLWTKGSRGELITIYCAFNAYDEACFVADCIQIWVKNGGSLSECAILYRNNVQSVEIEKVFLQRGIVYQIYGGMKFFQRQEIKDTLSYLRLILNHNDDIAFERILNTPPRGIGIRTLEIVREASREHNLTFWEATKIVLKNKRFAAKKSFVSLKNFIDLVDSLEKIIKNIPLYMQIKRILKDSGLLLMYSQEKGDAGQIRIQNLKELINTTRQYDSDLSHDKNLIPLQVFLSQLMLEVGPKSVDKVQDAVRLMTTHSSKGLEFMNVFIIGMEEGIFPGQISLNEVGGLEEERRLAYVGITRAMVKLTLTYAKSRRLYGKEVCHTPSRFINEIPSKCTKKIHYRERANQGLQYERVDDIGIIKHSDLKAHKRVQHLLFGEGSIIKSIGHGEQKRLKIHFDSDDIKWLLATYVKLI
ncbi:DNA helicase II [Candidatus Erwinia haradaeae]|uniref:DNA 3'-5' helicase n=1 Tax=Candidatus Erwinia haradaeae TaxID=1922217 RepID=A0A451D1R9_9GAMM|nr:DNA helicase II [Candidatus Erwinia haradaeae]VFP79556.1 DNA helicase II [Candidatus Erwinia haradaeae]